MARRVVIRADASSQIGSGHLMRCLTLAAALREGGAQVEFVCREHDGDLIPLVERRMFAVTKLPRAGKNFRAAPRPAHSAWLGASSEEDGAQTATAIGRGAMPQWLIVDHYGIGADWETALRARAERIMVIDDLADREHDCDLLLDQNLVASMESRYEGKVPDGAALLLGPRYALLQPQYSEVHSKARVRAGPPKRILISFGGADRKNLTGAAMEAVAALAGVEADVVSPEQSEHHASVQEMAAGNPRLKVHSSVSSLAPLMEAADIAVGAAGATSWERLCAGLPALVVTLAENQRPIADELNRRGLVRVLGSAEDVDAATITKALDELVRSGLEPSWSRRCLAVVDGRGTARVCELLLADRSSELHARAATPDDEALLLSWANDRGTRRNAFSSKPIDPDVHHHWLSARLKDSGGCRIYIVETSGGTPVGQARFQREGGDWEVHYGIAPELRGRGLGSSFLETALGAFREKEGSGVAKVFGRVKEENRASRRIFETLGFSAAPSEREAVIIYRRAL